MKKYTSLISVIIIMLTMCGAIPAHASASYDGFPFVCENFEDGNKENVIISEGTGKIMTVAPGAGESGFALRHIITENDGELKFSLDSQGFAPGQNLRAQAWIRLKNEIIDKTVTFMLCGVTTDGEEASFDLAISPELAVDEWVHVSASGFWSGLFTNGEKCDRTQPMYLKVRIGTGAPAEDAADGGTITYDIDDIVFEPDASPAAETEGTNIVTNGTFANGKTGWGGSVSVVEGEDAPEGNEYAIIEATTASFMQLTQNLTFAANHIYHISYWVKGDEAYNNKGEATDTAGIYMLQSARNRVVDTNSYNTDLPGYVTPEFPVDGQWHKIDFYYQFEFKTFTNQQFQTIFRIFPKGMQHTAATGRFGIDDIKIVDLGAVSNGKFESEDHTVQKFLNPTGEANKSTVTATEQNVLGWNEQNAETGLSTDTRPASTGKQSMRVSITEDDGYAYQGVGLDKADTDYKIGFWAKGENLPEESVPFSLVLDRSVAKPGGDMESYIVPDYEYYTGKNEVNNDGSFGTWRLTDEWNFYECIVSNSFGLKEGLTAPNENTIPRLPFLYFNVDGNSVGTTYFLDDITISEYDPELDTSMENAHPYCTDVSFTSSGYETGSISVQYDFHSLRGANEGGTVLRLFKKVGNSEVLVAATTEKTIEIPMGLAGASVRAELVPIDDRQTIGRLYYNEYTIEPAVSVVPEITAWNSDTGEINATVSITNNTKSGEDQSITVILAVYDASNKMVDYQTVVTEMGTEGSSIVPVGLTATENAACAKVYVWSGSELFKAGETVYSKVVTRVK